MVQGTKCTFCDAKFDQNCELEKHVVEDHQQEKEHSCEVCDKKFNINMVKKSLMLTIVNIS